MQIQSTEHTKWVRVFALALWLIALSAPGVQAQDHSSNVAKIDAYSEEVDRLAAGIAEDGTPASVLEQTRKRALEISEELQDVASELSPEAEKLKQQLAALKPKPPAEGEGKSQKIKESEKAKQEREKIEARLTKTDGTIKRATAVAAHAAQVAEKISTLAEERFARKILDLEPSPLSVEFWVEGIKGLSPALGKSIAFFTSSFQQLLTQPAVAIILLIALALSYLIGFVGWARRAVLSLIVGKLDVSLAERRGRQIAALLLMALVCFIPIFVTKVAFLYAQAWGMISWSVGIFFDKYMISLVIFSAVLALVHAHFAPQGSARRLSLVDDNTAKKFSRLIMLPVSIAALGVLLEGVELAASWPQKTFVMTNSLLALVFAVFILFGARQTRRLIGLSPELRQEISSIRFGNSLPFLFELAGVAIILVVLFGYYAFGWFISKQVVWIFTVICAAAFTGNAFNRLFVSEIDVDARLVSRAAQKSGIKPARLVQLGIIMSGLMWIVLAVLALALIIYPFTPSSTTLVGHLDAVLTKLQIGAAQVTGQEIALAVISLVVTIMLVRIFRRWMANHFLPATDLDSGIKNSLLTAIGYVGYLIAFLLTLFSLGIDLSNIALLASALSVGIGFGLQSVVSNFVSGLILLVERPIRVGDWIQTGTEEGIVRKINVRATEIETFSKETVVVPNADLISNVVKNRMLAGTVGRISIPIGVAYGTNSRSFQELLLSIAADHDQILSDPAPHVFFVDFGDSALMFELRAYVPNISNGFSVASDLRFEILEKCAEHGIEIPFPQRDVHIKSETETPSDDHK